MLRYQTDVLFGKIELRPTLRQKFADELKSNLQVLSR